jgi:adenine-specific DNA-methyltransferase
MAKKTARKSKEVADYRHEEATRPNNPPAGLAWQDTAPPPKRKWAYDPHLDPTLHWTGKQERTEFEVEAPSIHVHERLSTEAILSAVRKEPSQPSLFEDPELDHAKAIEFYEHEMGWTNRMVLGDSLTVTTSLLERERLGGRVQMIYIDPPYGINFNSNFQARISKRTQKEGADDSLTREPEQVQAYRDTWELGIHTYLGYLRDRLLVSRELLSDSGSLFVQIGPDNMHLVRVLLDEVFGPKNCCAVVTVGKTSQVTSKLIPEVSDYLLWYAKDKEQVFYAQLFEERDPARLDEGYNRVEEPGGARRVLTAEDRANPASVRAAGGRICTLGDATSQGFSKTKTVDFEFNGETYHPGPNRHWLLRREGMEELARAGRLDVIGNTLRYVRYEDDFRGVRRTNIWTDTGQAGFAQRKKAYVVETNPKIVERCIAMTTRPGDLVIDPTCGSGTTAWACEKLGRRWITTDTSRVALALARERLLTAKFDYFQLSEPERGVASGFEYRELSRVTASSIGYGEPEAPVKLYDQPLVDANKIRVSGPFTFEALSRYAFNPDEADPSSNGATDASAEALDHVQVLLEALRAQGIPRQGGKPIPIESLDPIANAGFLQAEGTYCDDKGNERSFAVSLGPRFGSITATQINEAMHDAAGYHLVVFAGFAATAEAQAWIAKGKLGRSEVALLEANADLLVGDLLKNTSASQTFRLFASPDAEVRDADDDEVVIEVMGTDAFDASTGQVLSTNREGIAAWFLDQNYDGIVFHANQAFFPRASAWDQLQKALKGTLDTELMERLNSFESLPFKAGEHKRAAIRLVDDSGTTSEAVLELG